MGRAQSLPVSRGTSRSPDLNRSHGNPDRAGVVRGAEVSNGQQPRHLTTERGVFTSEDDGLVDGELPGVVGLAVDGLESESGEPEQGQENRARCVVAGVPALNGAERDAHGCGQLLGAWVPEILQDGRQPGRVLRQTVEHSFLVVSQRHNVVTRMQDLECGMRGRGRGMPGVRDGCVCELT